MRHTLRKLMLALVLVTAGCAGSTSEPAAQDAVTYTGLGTSMEGSYVVHVTMDGDTIRDVTVDAQFPDSLPEEFRQQGIEAVNTVAAQVKKNNAPTADMISGATVTCQAVLDGVSDCLNQAGLLTPEAYPMKDGTYQSAVFGNNNLIEVEVTIANQAIKAVKVLSEQETSGVGAPLKDKNGDSISFGGKRPIESYPETIVAEQNLYPDIVTGATVTSYDLLTAVKDCIRQAGGNAYLFRGNGEAAVTEEYSGDVVIVGAGGTGLAAAVRLAQDGKQVVLVEKNGSAGGNTLVCGAIYNCPDPELQDDAVMNDAQKETILAALSASSEDPETQKILEELQAPVEAQWKEYQKNGDTGVFDSAEWYTLQTWLGGDMVADPELVKTLCENAYEGYEWITSMGMEFGSEIGQGAGSLWQRTHTSLMPMGTGFISTYLSQLEQYGDQVQIVANTTATDLILENNRVTGVKAVDNGSGKEVIFHAEDGVILSTGGFSANRIMVEENNTSGKWPSLIALPTTNRGSATGDGIVMAENAGASVRDMEQIQLLYLGNPFDGQLTKYPPRDVNGTDQIIFVNSDGERFVREDGRRDEICLAILKQKDGRFYMLESGDGDLYQDITDPSWRSADGFTFDYLLSNGYILTDDSLEGLAEQAGMDPAVLQKTVDAFNGYAEKTGTDPFGRTLYSTTLTNGPWVMTQRQVSVHHTMGGIQIDTGCHVLNEKGEIIPGLYAAGEVTGGIHGANRLGGNAVVETVVFGKLAAETILSETD